MKLEEYKEQMDTALEKLDWREPTSKKSEAYGVLAKAAADREVDTEAWMQLHDRYWEAVKRR